MECRLGGDRIVCVYGCCESRLSHSHGSHQWIWTRHSWIRSVLQLSSHRGTRQKKKKRVGKDPSCSFTHTLTKINVSTYSISIGMAGNGSFNGSIGKFGIHWDDPSEPPFIRACNLRPYGSNNTYYPTCPWMIYVVTYPPGSVCLQPSWPDSLPTNVRYLGIPIDIWDISF